MKIILGDVETAGFMKPRQDASGVVQVAALELEEVDGKLVEVRSFKHLVNPGCAIEDGAKEIHGISNDDVEFMPDFNTVFKLAAEAGTFDLYGDVFFIAHNKAFDFQRFSLVMENCVGGLCTLQAARRIMKDAPNHKLGTLVQHYGLEMLDAHDALNDCRMTLQVLNLQLKMAEMSVTELAEMVSTPKTPTEMPFGKYKGAKFSELGSGYIRWMLDREDLDKGLRLALEMERRIRGNGL